MSKLNRDAQKQYILTRNYWKSEYEHTHCYGSLGSISRRWLSETSRTFPLTGTKSIRVVSWRASLDGVPQKCISPFTLESRLICRWDVVLSGLNSFEDKRYSHEHGSIRNLTNQIWIRYDVGVTRNSSDDVVPSTDVHVQSNEIVIAQSKIVTRRNVERTLFTFLSTTWNCTSSVTESPDPNDRERNVDSWPLARRASNHTSSIVWTLDGTKSDPSSDSELSCYFSQVNLFLPSESRLRRRLDPLWLKSVLNIK